MCFILSGCVWLLHLDDVWVQRNFLRHRNPSYESIYHVVFNTLKSDDKFNFYSGFEH